MALADCAMYVVLLSAIGPVGLAVTTNLSINFPRKGSPAGCACAAGFETGQAACGGRGQSAVGNFAGPDRPCNIDLFPFQIIQVFYVI